VGLAAGAVNEFLLRECAHVRPATAGCFASQLRSLLRYLAVRGLAEPGLADAVPVIARWRQATIPQFPPRPQIDLGMLDGVRATSAAPTMRMCSLVSASL
jgi:hypothetical protein